MPAESRGSVFKTRTGYGIRWPDTHSSRAPGQVRRPGHRFRDAVERRDIDRSGPAVVVQRRVADGVLTPYPKTGRRRVPLSTRAAGAVEALPLRLDTALLFPAAQGAKLISDVCCPFAARARLSLECVGRRFSAPAGLHRGSILDTRSV
jgi:hypothetical protein